MIATLMVAALLFRGGECIVSGAPDAVSTPAGAGSRDDSDPQQSTARGFAYGDDGDFGYHDAHGYGEGHADHYAVNFEPGKYQYHDHEHQYHKHDPTHHKALAIKGLLIPLAGVALLGAAAALVSNPILLQLGVISSAYGRKRREVGSRSAGNDEDPRVRAQKKLREIQMLERFVAQVPGGGIRAREGKLLADYLTSSGDEGGASCLERLACELHSEEGGSMPIEANVMAIITNEIFDNDFVPESLKWRIEKAARRGSSDEECAIYACKRFAPPAKGGRGDISLASNPIRNKSASRTFPFGSVL